MSDKPKVLWASWFCMGVGLEYRKPIKVRLVGDEGWDSTDGLRVKNVGLEIGDGYAIFASTSKKEVKLFISGAATFIEVCLKHFVD